MEKQPRDLTLGVSTTVLSLVPSSRWGEAAAQERCCRPFLSEGALFQPCADDFMTFSTQ